MLDEDVKIKRSKQSKRQRTLAKVEELIGENFDDFEIEEKLGLSPEQLQKYKQMIFDRYRMALHTLTPEKVFSEYAMKMNVLVKELDEAIGACREGNQLQAMVSGIWRKKEIADSVIKFGQELGFLPKNAKEVKITNDISFSSMTNEEVKAEVTRIKQSIVELATRKIHIRPEVAQFMDPVTRANLPDSMVLLGSKSNAINGKGKIPPRKG